MAGARRSARGAASDAPAASADASDARKKRAKAKDATKSSNAKTDARSNGKAKARAVAAPAVADGNRLKRETAFLCHAQFKNDLPAVPIDWKMLQTRVDRRALTEYSHLPLYDGLRKRGDFSEDLGIPLDPALMRAYRVPTRRVAMDPEDHELMMSSAEREGKRNGAIGTSGRAVSRPDASDALWLMNTQYISAGSIKARTGLSEKEMKRRRLEAQGGAAEPEVELSQVEQIEASFAAAKRPPVHPTNKKAKVVEVLPVLPDFERIAMDYVRLNFDEKQETDVASLSGKSAETIENALNCGVVKPFSIVNERNQTERFLSLMLPQDPDAAMEEDFLALDGEPRQYDHVRDYVYKIHQDDPNLGGGNMCFFFKKDRVTYVDLHTKLTLSKRSKHSKGKEATDSWKPSEVTLQRRRMTEEEKSALDAKRESIRAGA
jgi:RNA polymerase II-associated factor 1